MTNLNEKIVANIGDIVWFLKPEFIDTDDLNDSKIYFNEIHQGKVISVTGATDCATCIEVIDINGDKFIAIQELFFINFKDCLNAFNTVKNKSFGRRTGWSAEYIDAVKLFILYNYELLIPYEQGIKLKTTYNNIEYDAIVHRVLFDISNEEKVYPWSNQVSLQVIIEELNLAVEVTKKDLPILGDIKITKKK